MSLLIYGFKNFILILYLFHYNLCYAVSESEEILMEEVKFSVQEMGTNKFSFHFFIFIGEVVE